MPVEQGIGPIVARIDDPPAEPLGGFAWDRRISLELIGPDRCPIRPG